MSPVVRVALVGFTPFERDTFNAFFRLAPRREPSYQLTDGVASCDLAVVNADDALCVAAVRQQGVLGRTLMLGATPQPGAAEQLPRPADLLLVLRALDSVMLKAQAPSPSVLRVLDDLATVTNTIAANIDPRRLAAAAAAEPAVDLLLPVRRRVLDHILVVDSNDLALRFMATHLERFGFQVHLARSGVEAIERVSKRHFEFVFLDATLEGLDAFHTCKAIKRNTYADNRPTPTVVMLTRRGMPVDQFRSGAAGSDAVLEKPLREKDLLKVVGNREVIKHAYVETADGTRSMV
jgi:CheY-like chemotaxis protein